MNNSESTELNALRALHQCASEEVKAQLDLHAIELETGFVSIAGKLPAGAIVVNRALGFKENSGRAIQTAIEAYKEGDVERYFIQLEPSEDVERLLLEQGLTKARAWQKFELVSEDYFPSEIAENAAMTVKKVDSKYGGEFARITCAAFDLMEAAEPWLKNLPNADNWHVFMAFVDDKPAGVGGLFLKDEYAWLDFGATALEFRQRGCQTAVLRERVKYAFDHGCKKVFTCTGVEVEGDPQHSYKNIMKVGFTPTYIRNNYSNR